MSDEVDLFADSEGTAPSDNDLKSVSVLADQIKNKQAEIEQLESQLKEKREALARIEEVDLPDLMLSLGLRDFTMVDGAKIKIEDVVRASISVSNRGEAFDWLTSNGHGDLIKKTVAVSLGREAPAEHITMLQDMATGLGYSTAVTDKVEPSTLSAFVRGQLAEGANIPMELFGVYQGRKAVIKQKKGTKNV